MKPKKRLVMIIMMLVIITPFKEASKNTKKKEKLMPTIGCSLELCIKTGCKTPAFLVETSLKWSFFCPRQGNLTQAQNVFGEIMFLEKKNRGVELSS